MAWLTLRFIIMRGFYFGNNNLLLLAIVRNSYLSTLDILNMWTTAIPFQMDLGFFVDAFLLRLELKACIFHDAVL